MIAQFPDESIIDTGHYLQKDGLQDVSNESATFTKSMRNVVQYVAKVEASISKGTKREWFTWKTRK